MKVMIMVSGRRKESDEAVGGDLMAFLRGRKKKRSEGRGERKETYPFMRKMWSSIYNQI